MFTIRNIAKRSKGQKANASCVAVANARNGAIDRQILPDQTTIVGRGRNEMAERHRSHTNCLALHRNCGPPTSHSHQYTNNKIERPHMPCEVFVAWMAAHEKENLQNLSVFFSILTGALLRLRNIAHSPVADNRQAKHSHFAHRSRNGVELAFMPKISEWVCLSEGDTFHWCDCTNKVMLDERREKVYSSQCSLRSNIKWSASVRTLRAMAVQSADYELFFRFFFFAVIAYTNSRPTNSTRFEHHRCVNLIFLFAFGNIRKPSYLWVRIASVAAAAASDTNVSTFSTTCEVIIRTEWQWFSLNIVHVNTEQSEHVGPQFRTFRFRWFSSPKIVLLDELQWIFYFYRTLQKSNRKWKKNGISQERRVYQVLSDRAEF